MAKTAQAPESFAVGAQAIALGALSNTLSKLGLALGIDSAAFKRRAGGGLAAIAAAGAAVFVALSAWR